MVGMTKKPYPIVAPNSGGRDKHLGEAVYPEFILSAGLCFRRQLSSTIQNFPGLLSDPVMSYWLIKADPDSQPQESGSKYQYPQSQNSRSQVDWLQLLSPWIGNFIFFALSSCY